MSTYQERWDAFGGWPEHESLSKEYGEALRGALVPIPDAAVDKGFTLTISDIPHLEEGARTSQPSVGLRVGGELDEDTKDYIRAMVALLLEGALEGELWDA